MHIQTSLRLGTNKERRCEEREERVGSESESGKEAKGRRKIERERERVGWVGEKQALVCALHCSRCAAEV